MSLETVRIFSWETLPAEQVNPDIRRKFITGARTTLAQFWLRKGALIPEHAHESEQLSWVLEGRIRLIVAGESQTLGPGEVLRIPSNLPHSAEVLEDCHVADIFSPLRQDWLDRTDDYLRRSTARR